MVHGKGKEGEVKGSNQGEGEVERREEGKKRSSSKRHRVQVKKGTGHIKREQGRFKRDQAKREEA